MAKWLNEGIVALHAWARAEGRTLVWVARQLRKKGLRVEANYLSRLRTVGRPSEQLAQALEELTDGGVTVRKLRPGGDHMEPVRGGGRGETVPAA